MNWCGMSSRFLDVSAKYRDLHTAIQSVKLSNLAHFVILYAGLCISWLDSKITAPRLIGGREDTQKIEVEVMNWCGMSSRFLDVSAKIPRSTNAIQSVKLSSLAHFVKKPRRQDDTLLDKEPS